MTKKELIDLIIRNNEKIIKISNMYEEVGKKTISNLFADIANNLDVIGNAVNELVTNNEQHE